MTLTLTLAARLALFIFGFFAGRALRRYLDRPRYDNGGVPWAGPSLVRNDSGRPEPVLARGRLI